jgi:Tfp pilus assembly protein PilX
METTCKGKSSLPSLNIAARTLRSERGVSLVVVIMLMVIILAITSAGMLFSSMDLRVSGNYKAGAQAFYAADNGVTAGLVQVGANQAASIAPIPKTEVSPGSGLFYCSGRLTQTNNCTTPQPSQLVNTTLPPPPGYDICCFVSYQYQINVTGVGPLSAAREVEAQVTYAPMSK